VKAGGAAFSSTVLGYIKGAIPAEWAITDDILTTVIGFVLEEGWLIKNPLVKDFGEGMMISGLTMMISTMFPQSTGSIHFVGGGTSSSPRPSVKTIQTSQGTRHYPGV
jgi:hypothetical protein